MACVILKDIEGNKREIPENVPFEKLPGEKIVGINVNCGLKEGEKPRLPNTFMILAGELNAEIGEGKGDWIKALAKPVAKLLGKTGCSNCEARRIVTNAYAKLKGKHGQAEALRLIKDLWVASASNPEEALLALKEHLKN